MGKGDGLTRDTDLADATDEQIEEAVRHTDPLVLRGLIYQLTGDESIAATRVAPARGYVGGDLNVAIADPAHVELVQSRAAAWLEAHRDAGGGPVDIGPRDRIPKSLALSAGLEQLPAGDEELWLEELALDPWVRGLHWEEGSPAADWLQGFSVLVIGAGMGGLNAAAQLKKAGIDFTVVEKNPGVGGTWFENRYPGARVDSPSRAYTHIIGVDFDCPSPWCTREENQRYFDWVADTYGVREKIVFGTEVTTMTWDEAGSVWEVETKGPDGARTWRVNAVISAVGLLSRPSLPDIEGMAAFEGPSFHTARWPDHLDLSTSRVAVIGSGCSGTQLVPALALQAGHVFAFQRTPQWLFEHDGYLSPFPDQTRWLDRNLPFHRNFTRFRTNWLLSPYLSKPLREIDPDFEDPYARSAVNKQIRDERVAYIREKLAGRPDLAEKMIPPHPPFSARPVQVDSDYNLYDALLRDNVTLVTEGIDRITETGIATKDGADHQVDAIVYATGFKANECLWPMQVRGRGGRTIEELWAKDGPRAYLGTMMPGFPNLFLIYGPNMNPYGGLGVVNHQEMVTRLLLECIRRLVEGAKSSIEVTEAAYWRYNDQLDERETYKIYKDPRAGSYYRNEHGRSAVNCPFDGNEMWHRLRNLDPDDVVIS